MSIVENKRQTSLWHFLCSPLPPSWLNVDILTFSSPIFFLTGLLVWYPLDVENTQFSSRYAALFWLFYMAVSLQFQDCYARSSYLTILHIPEAHSTSPSSLFIVLVYFLTVTISQTQDMPHKTYNFVFYISWR